MQKEVEVEKGTKAGQGENRRRRMSMREETGCMETSGVENLSGGER